MTSLFCGWSKLIWFSYPGRNVWASDLNSFLCGWSRLTWFNCGGSNLTWFQSRDRNWLGFGIGIEVDRCFSCGDRNLIVCLWGGRKWLGLSVGVEKHGFIVGIRIGLVLVSRHQNWLVFIGGTKLAWFQCRDRNWLDFGMGVENVLVVAFGSKTTWCPYGYRNWLCVWRRK